MVERVRHFVSSRKLLGLLEAAFSYSWETRRLVSSLMRVRMKEGAYTWVRKPL